MSRLLRPVPGALVLLIVQAGAASAHSLTERYQAPLPLLAYVAGAAAAVALSFVFVMLRGGPAAPGNREAPRTRSAGQPAAGGRSSRRRAADPEANVRARTVPAWLRNGLRIVGIVAWTWIVVQALAGGSSLADVSSLFLWVYGWVGLALVSALLGPAWAWIDPFSTLHAGLTTIGRRTGLASGEDEPGPYPERLGIWAAVAGFAVVVWLELVGRVEGGSALGLVLVGYTFVTLAGMSYFGRGAWRRNAEIFSVWFGLLGRLAPFRLAGSPEEGRVLRQPLGAGLRRGEWTVAHLVLLTLGTGAIIYDGLSQTEIHFALFGLHSAPVGTLILAGFMGILLLLVLFVARGLGAAAVGAGLLPVAVGYLIAHYLTYLLVDGQRIVHALNDPLQRGDNLLPFDIGFTEPALFLPAAIVWSIQLAAVVGGHVIGAWSGHALLADQGGGTRIMRQVPLAVLMVIFTSITLWSLGQAVIEPAASLVRII